MAKIDVLSPVRSAGAAPRLTLAPRAEPASGGHLTLICNGKPKAREILDLLAHELRAWLSLGEVELHVKRSAGYPLEPEVARDLAARSDFAIAAIGDCGACSACSLHDAVQMEALGVPATVVITDVFQRSVAAHAHELGASGYHAVVLPHPISSRSDERIGGFVHDVAATVRDQLTVPLAVAAAAG